MLWNYLHLNKKLVVGNLKWKCENKAITNIAKSIEYSSSIEIRSIYNTYIEWIIRNTHIHNTQYSK
jgi:hypothetical protein